MNSTVLTTESIPILLRRLAIPSSLGMVFNTLYNVVDTYYAGLLSTEALAALSSSFFLFFVIVGLGYGGSTALTALIGNALGRKHPRYAGLIAKKGLVLVLFLGMILGLLGYISAPTMLRLIGVVALYHTLALEYIQIILGGTVLFFANFALNGILVATGDTKSYRNTLLFGFIANMLLNPLFMYGWGFIPAMGIGGIAASTVLIQGINALYLLQKSIHTGLISFETLQCFYPDWRIYKNLIAQGLAPGLNMLMMSFGSLIALYFVTEYGYKAVAGYGIGYRVEQLLLLPALGISSATLSLVSINMGAGKIERVREIIFAALKYGYTISLVGIIVLYALGEWLIGRFDSDPEVIAFGIHYLLVMVFVFFGFVTHFVCVATLQGMKHPAMIFYIGAYRQLIAPLIFFTLIAKIWELSFIWLWIGLAFIVYSSAVIILWHTFKVIKKHDTSML
ncbi:MAG: MATE family efflux transporter [Campylobacteraceae bacterium]|nr:MATE family efflux transporter [Campylobacteraceae bacterium]